MASLNKVTIIGNVGRDPESRMSASGKQFCTFSVATSDGKDKETTWFNVTCFERQAETCQQYVAKGMLVYVEGRLQISRYEKDGVEKQSVSVIANRVIFLSSKQKDDAGGVDGVPF